MNNKSEKTRKPAKHKVFSDGDKRYTFYCELSNIRVYTVKNVIADTPEEELIAAWNEAKEHFNFCPRCGRNVCDMMFNADISECVSCAPWQTTPVFCEICGAKLLENNNYCVKCGKIILKQGVDNDAGM